MSYVLCNKKRANFCDWLGIECSLYLSTKCVLCIMYHVVVENIFVLLEDKKFRFHLPIKCVLCIMYHVTENTGEKIFLLLGG